jgi:hypothetical protein
MTNIVNVNVTADVAPSGAGAEGNIVAVPSGTMWPDAGGNPIVPMVVHGTLGDASLNIPGECQIPLVASDNYAVNVLTWDLIINIRGFPTINVPRVPVNFASGATQNVWTILATMGWVPPSLI